MATEHSGCSVFCGVGDRKMCIRDRYDTVFPAFADRMVSRLAAIGAVGAAAAFLKWEWTVAVSYTHLDCIRDRCSGEKR